MAQNVNSRLLGFPESFSATPSNASYNETGPDVVHCVPLRKVYLLIVSLVPALVIIENVIFLIAVGLYRQKLKHNNVYRYVASALVANVVTSSLGFYHFLNYYFGFEPYEPNPWWAFRKGMTLALSLILCGNIGLVIYGVDASTYVVGRVSRTSPQSANLNPKYRRRKANLLICLVWALPTIYGMLAMSNWNCTKNCSCTLHYDTGKALCPEEHCSKLYTPMAKTYLLVVVMLWALECSGLIILLCKSIYAVRHTDSDRITDNSSEQRYMSLRRTLNRYYSTHRVVFLLFGLFIICTAPVMILFIIDFACSSMHFSHVLVNFITPLPLVYCFVSPLLLTQKLSGVRSALLMAMTFSWMKSSTTKPKMQPRKYNNNVGATTSMVSKDSSMPTSV